MKKRLCDPEKVKSHRFFEDIDFEALLAKRLAVPYLPGEEQLATSRDSKSRRHGMSWEHLDEDKENIFEDF